MFAQVHVGQKDRPPGSGERVGNQLTLLPGLDAPGPPAGTSTVLPKTAIGALADVGS